MPDAARPTYIAGMPYECPRCGYRLSGAVSRVCPECGCDAVKTLDELNVRRARLGVGARLLRSAWWLVVLLVSPIVLVTTAGVLIVGSRSAFLLATLAWIVLFCAVYGGVRRR